MSKFRFLSLMAGAAVLGGALAGCAGDVSLPVDTAPPTIPVSGEVDQDAGTSNESRAASEQPQQVQVTTPDGVVSVQIPADVPVTAGEQIAVFPSGQQIFPGMTRASTTRAPGDIFVKRLRPTETQSKLWGYIDEQGRIRRSNSDGDPQNKGLGLPPGRYQATLIGPFNVSSNRGSLTIREFIIEGDVVGGVASIYNNVNGRLPVNGGSTAVTGNHQTDPYLELQFPGSFNGYTVTLHISHDNGSLSKTKVITNGMVRFEDLSFSQGSSTIPPHGVNQVRMTVNAP